MENRELSEELNALEKELSGLPVGYISRKTIYGKKKCYHQWMEDGKKKSKYVEDATADMLQKSFSRRKELQERIKQIRAIMKTPKKERIDNQTRYNTNVLTGQLLRALLADISGFRCRELLPRIEEYLYGAVVPRVFIMYGLRRTGKTGKDMANVLEMVGITANKNTVPNDPQSPFVTSGIRLGAAAATTRGFDEEAMREVARIISEAIKNSDNESVLKELRNDSLNLCKKFPLYEQYARVGLF